MQDLTPVGLSQDGKTLILVSSRGVEFSVSVDEALRNALRGDQSRLGQLEMTMESTLRPRDIQSRIRTGETPEAVAGAANTSVDKIMVYAGPVLAERAHIAQSAQVASIKRRNADGSASARTLAEAAPSYLREIGTRPDDVEWDAWRREDGRWTVVADYVVDEQPRRAEFSYDVPGRYVTADNDAARLLTGEARPAPSAAGRSAGPASGRRLSAVPSQDRLPLGDDPNDDLGEDALELVRESEPAFADHADADWIAPPAMDTDTATSGDSDEKSRTGAVTSPDEEVTAEIDLEQHSATPEPDEPAAGARPRKKGRAQVPSWDEIMFGGGKSE